jgi:zinc protease
MKKPDPFVLFFILCASLLARPTWAVAQSADAAAPLATAVVQQHTLSNGLQVIVRPDRRAPTVVHMLWLRVGSMDEQDGTSGIAHMLEHMMFKGSAQLKEGEFSRRVAQLGGSDNAFTAKDYTAYFQIVPSQQLGVVMALEADRFASNQWPDAAFHKEREVVTEERRLRVDDQARSALYEQLMATALVASPYRRPIIGWMDDIAAYTAQDVRDFYRRWYHASNAAVVIAGDVDPAQALALAERHYGQLPRGQLPARKPQPEPAQRGLKRLDFAAPAKQAYVTLAFRAPKLVPEHLGTSANVLPEALQAEEGRDSLALTLLAAVLDGYSGARLDRALVQGPSRVADSVGAYYSPMGRGPQFFMLDGVPAAGQTTAQVEAALRAAVARVAQDGVTEQELQRVKNQWRAQETYKLDSVMNQARELGVAWALGFDPRSWSAQLMRQLEAVTAAQVQAVAARYFGDVQLTVGTLLPTSEQSPAPQQRSASSHRH